MASTTYYSVHTDFVTRIRPSAELVNQFGGAAEFYGGAQFKSKAAAAKRTATTLRKTVDELGDAASQADIEALKKAASVLSRQAEELAVFAKWADAYHSFCQAAQLKKDLDKARSFAQARWGEDTQAHRLESQLLEACDTMSGTERLGLFVLKHYPQFGGIKPENFILGGYRSLSLKGADERENTAYRLSMLDAHSRPYESRTYGPSATIGRDIFDAYIAHRRAELEAKK